MKFWALLGGRKFIVFAVATVGWLVLNKLESWHWVIIAVAYIGGNIAKAFFESLKAK